MNPDSAHKSRWAIAEVVFGVPFLLGAALNLLAPGGGLRLALRAAGVVLFLAGVGLVSAARRELAALRQPTDPGHPTSRIVTTGVFAYSRNPLYLACVLLYVGMALALNLPWALALLPIALIACHSVLIVPEEKYLAAKFGAEYQQYTAAVRRWLGRK